MAGPAFVAVATSQNATAEATATVSIPSHTSGDLLVVIISSTLSSPMPAWSTPAGWTAGPTAEAGNYSAVRVSSFVKEGNGSETTVDISMSSGTAGWGAACAAYSGADTTSPIDQQGITVQESGVNISSPSVTTTEADTKVIFAYIFDHDKSTDADHDSDAGFKGTSRWYYESSRPGNGFATAFSDYDKATAGATGTCVWSSNGDSDAGGALTFNIKSGAVEVPLLGDDVESAAEVSVPTLGVVHNLIADNSLTLEDLDAVNPSLDALPYSLDSNMYVATAGTQSTSELSVPTLASEDALLADDIQSTSNVSVPDVGQAHILLATSVESTSNVSVPDVGQTHAILATGAESASNVSVPDVGQTHVVLADDIQSATEVSVPTVAQTQVLLANDVESASETSTAALAQVHNLSSTSVESTSELTVPDAGQTHVLLSTSVESTSELSAPLLTDVPDAINPLLGEDVESASEVTQPTLVQIHVLLGNDIESSSELTEPTLDRSTVVVPKPPVYRGGFFVPDEKDIQELLKIIEADPDEKTQEKIEKLEEAAVEVLDTGTKTVYTKEALAGLDFAQRIMGTNAEKRQAEAQALLEEAARLALQSQEDDEIIELLLMAA